MMKIRSTNAVTIRSILTAILFGVCLMSSSAAAQQPAELALADPETLRGPVNLTRRISAGEVHRYKISLKRGDVHHVRIIQQGANIIAAAAKFETGSPILAEVNSATGPAGAESLVFMAESDGDYVIGIFGRDPVSKSAGSYTLHNEAPLSSQAEKLAAAHYLDRRGGSVSGSNDIALARLYRERAVGLLSGLPPTAEAGWINVNLGNDLFELGEHQASIDVYETALDIYRALKIPGDEGVTLVNISSALSALSQHQASVASLNRALPLLASTDKDRTRALALFLLGENHKRLQNYSDSTASYQKAAELFRMLKIDLDEANSYFGIADNFFRIEDFERAAAYYQRTLVIDRRLNDPVRQATSISNIGLAQLRMEKESDAMDSLRQSLDLIAGSKAPVLESKIHLIIGEAHFESSRIAEALAQYEISLKKSREAGDKTIEIASIRGIGSAYSELGNYERSLEYQLEGLKLAEGMRDDLEIAMQLGNIAISFVEQGKYEKAFDYNTRSLAIYRRLKDKHGERTMLNNLGVAYLRLGSMRKAEEYMLQSFALNRDLKDRRKMAVSLANLGTIYTRLKQYDKAISYFDQAKPLLEEFKLYRFIVTANYYHGMLRRERGEIDQAIRLHQAAIDVARMARTPKFEARARVELGLDLLQKGAVPAAITHFQDALMTARTIKAVEEESAAFDGLMRAHARLGSNALAIFYGKRSINLLQSIRGEISKFDKDTQANYLKDNETTYRQLAEMLAAEGRLPEAQQVLGMLKEEELSGFVRRDSKEIENLSKRSDLRANERAALEKFSTISDRITDLAAELASMENKRRSLAAGEAFPDQIRYDELTAQIKNANTAFRIFLEKELAAELGTEKKREIDADRALQGKLRQWGVGTVALATMVGRDRYRVILTTPNLQIDGRSDISSAELNKKIFAFREALLDPKIDPRPLGRELYDILVKPIEKDLAAARATTLLWSLDGTLRYVPVAALWDGKQYLVEKYQNVVLTSTTRQSLQADVTRGWTILGAGVTKASQVTDAITARKISFDELAGVRKELSAILAPETKPPGAAKGVSLLDAAFTEEALKRELTQTVSSKRKFNVIHFATHFRLGSDTSDSFLLLGNNRALTLADVADSPELDLTDVELVTLSACNTGYGGLDTSALAENNGKEVDSLAQFIELRGAKSVLATLWAVADESTAMMMGEFYRLRGANPSWAKSEALRRAQLALLSGDKKGTQAQKRRSDPIVIDDGGTRHHSFTKDAARPFAHPHYWAPFVIIGNWR